MDLSTGLWGLGGRERLDIAVTCWIALEYRFAMLDVGFTLVVLSCVSLTFLFLLTLVFFSSISLSTHILKPPSA